MRIGRRLGWWLTALAIFIVVGALDLGGQLRTLENAAVDGRARLLRREVSSQIVIVGIDAQSIQALDRWPWPRQHHARLIENLSRMAPERVFLDVDFSSPATDSIQDAVLDSALARRRDFPIVLPTFFQYANSADGHLSISRPLPRFARSVDFAGVNVRPGNDGLTREWRNVWTIGGERIASVIDPHRLPPEEQSVPIDFSISPSSFTYVSYFDVLQNRVPLELGDMLAVPVYGQLPGIVVQALAAETVNIGAPRYVPRWASMLLLAGWTLLAALLFASNWRRNLAVLSLSVLFIAVL